MNQEEVGVIVSDFQRAVVNFCQTGKIDHQTRSAAFIVDFSGFVQHPAELFHSREIQVAIGFDDHSLLCDFVTLPAEENNTNQ